MQGTGKRRLADQRFLSPEKGLTLVEVLLAVSVLAVGIVGVLRGYASAITTLESGQYTIDAVNLMKEKMAEVEVMVREEDKIIAKQERGSFEGFFQEFLWEYEIKETEIEDLFILNLTVSSEYNPRTFSLTTLMAGKKSEEEG